MDRDPRRRARRPAPAAVSSALIVLRSLAFDAFLYALMGGMGLLCLPVAAASRDGAYAAIRLFCRIVLGALALFCGLRTEIRGRVPGGAVLVAAKHQSFLDVLVLMRVLPRPKFVMKRSLLWTPIFGFYAWRIGCVAIEREKGTSAMRRMAGGLSAQAGEAGQIVIYPQGTRAAPGAVLPYKPGAGLLYQRFGLACVPVATNAGLYWGRRSLLRRPGLALVEFLDTVPPGLPVRGFLQEIEARIETASARLAAGSGQ
jgi:1-acyl-sn-glycerol-3-phosphate acyltransferase